MLVLLNYYYKLSKPTTIMLMINVKNAIDYLQTSATSYLVKVSNILEALNI